MTIEGHEFTYSEIIRFIRQSEKHTKFDLIIFAKFFFYHLVHMLFWPLGILMIFFAEGYSLHLNYNLLFLGKRLGFFLQTAIGTCVSLSIYFSYMRYLESLDPDSDVEFYVQDQMRIVMTTLCRLVVINVKFGYYSKEHLFLIQRKVLPDFTIYFDFIYMVVYDKTIQIKLDRVVDEL